MLIHWQKNRIALISLNYFPTETCSLPLARSILVKKSTFEPILWPSDNATVCIHAVKFFPVLPPYSKRGWPAFYCQVEIATASSCFT